jgi:hypothetical protein
MAGLLWRRFSHRMIDGMSGTALPIYGSDVTLKKRAAAVPVSLPSNSHQIASSILPDRSRADLRALPRCRDPA